MLKAWYPSAIWLGVIAIESTSLGSSENTAHILYPIFHFLFALDPLRFAAWHHILRKTGHFIGYFTLSVLLFRSWRASLPAFSTRWALPWAAMAFLGTIVVASLDEWHQGFLPSRTSTFSDVILDSIAGLVAQLVLFCALRAFRSRIKEPQAAKSAPGS